MLSVKGLGYSVGDRTILERLDLEVPAGSSACVLGRSGSGKSTLLSCILGLLEPDEGEVWLGSTRISRLSGRELAEVRRQRIGMVFQHGELLPELTSMENVALAALLAGIENSLAYASAQGLLEEFDVPLETPTALLSGGERQRVAVARALVNEPELMLADEPTGSLDDSNRDLVADLIFSQSHTKSCSLVLVTHDVKVAERADCRYQLVAGRLTEWRG